MTGTLHQVAPEPARTFLRDVLSAHASPQALAWLAQQQEKYTTDYARRTLYMAFSMVPRFFSKTPLELSGAQHERADELRSGWDPSTWTCDQAARTFLLLLMPTQDEDQYQQTLKQLFDTADMNEQRTLYGALPLLAFPERWVAQTAEGIRTNITSVLDAIVLRNPYPAEHLADPAWNQLVLKSVFTDRPLYQIDGLDKRVNAELAHTLLDYVHERWSAGRTVTPELWRMIGPFLQPESEADIKRLLQSDNPLERQAGMLACWQSNDLIVSQWVDRDTDPSTLTWDEIGARHQETKN
ncbi:hypothetical protein SAMN05421823_10431 [Catalinimonas alkaloidigena]|uniref:Uncharacterized protein n=1 Tax=Catalinimonas alkaloidigena TaxID=1075417 RepID=A0A1G9G9C5_9BACT|nr:EboA domain-containing protein [Catalinimonas alkaloidigena]SDK97290.1 hypothetical protein SAMN05421823_10431 [Catalinimonas alkaloidigena]